MNAVEVIEVVKEYPEAEGGRPRRVLDAVSFEVAEGESLAIVGPSGCGKSTLLNLMGLLDTPTSGTLKMSGQDVASFTEGEAARFRASHVGFVFQMHHLLPQCTVLENVLVPTLAKPAGERASAARDRAMSLLEKVGLRDLSRKFPSQLSGGERQRIAVLRALINQPKVVLADEPTGALDQANAGMVRDLLVELCQDARTTLIMVTHDLNVAASLTRTLHLS